MARRLFTSESVTEGHPDKICDQISDAVLDAILEKDPTARVACDLAAYPTLETRADITLTGSDGVTGYVRVDWLSPEGLPTWGDPRTVITGQDGYIELRKNIDLGKLNMGSVQVKIGIMF